MSLHGTAYIALRGNSKQIESKPIHGAAYTICVEHIISDIKIQAYVSIFNKN